MGEENTILAMPHLPSPHTYNNLHDRFVICNFEAFANTVLLRHSGLYGGEGVPDYQAFRITEGKFRVMGKVK